MKKIYGYISAGDGRRLVPATGTEFRTGIYVENEMINVFPERRYQTIIGFGGAFTEASAFNYSLMNEENRQRVIRALFDRKEGLGYNFCRTHIHSCDFSISRYTYTSDDDACLASFSIDQDRKYTIPFVKAAVGTSEELLLFASPWSPPGRMKTNGELCHGGRLKKECYADWAEYLVKYFEEYEKEGIRFYAMTVQNEAGAWQTWESCEYTAEGEAEFVHGYLRPALLHAGYGDIKVMIWDHNKERVYERAVSSLKTPGAMEDIWGIAYHWYSGDHFNALDMTHEKYPDKPLVLTEAGLGGARGEALEGAYSTWENAEIYSRELIEDLNHYMSAAVEWNLILDECGGPCHDRPGGCKAPIIYDRTKGRLSVQPVYYATAHFSRFIRRGAVRLGTSSFCEKIKAAAFQNPGGEIILIILNCDEKEYAVHIRMEEEISDICFPAKSLSTYVIAENTEERNEQKK